MNVFGIHHIIIGYCPAAYLNLNFSDVHTEIELISLARDLAFYIFIV